MINHIQHTQFVENVLGIKLKPDQLCLMLEGKLPQNISQKILIETAIYEGFLDDLASKIGGVPKNIAKTLTDTTSVLTFIYNVISDKTGQNLKKAISILTRNCMAIFSKIERLGSNLSSTIKEVFTKVVNWVREKAKGVMGLQSDTDPSDKVSGDGSNWKKFLLLLLIGMVLIFLKQVPSLLKDFGEDIAKDGLSKVFDATQDLVAKFTTAPADMLKFVASGGLIKLLMPLIAMYKGAKILATINSDLLDSNAWLRKT